MNNIAKHIAGTYKAMRLALFLIGFSLPLILMIGGGMSKPSIPWATHSMSAYYHLSTAPESGPDGSYIYKNNPANLGTMRNWFVGGLFAIGTLLVAYKGIRTIENWVLNVAGVMALGVAVFPMSWIFNDDGGFKASSKFSPHGFCAVAVFLCIAYICIFRSWDTLTEKLIPDETRRKVYKVTYQLLGWSMVLLPLLAWVMASTNNRTFLIEALGIWVFAIYWLVKSWELAESKFDEAAASGKIHVTELQSKMDLVRQVPVIKEGP